MKKDDLKKYFKAAFKEAEKAVVKKHGGPFGALVVKNGRVISVAHNTVLKEKDPTCHAEINAIRRASRTLKDPHLKDCILFTTSEPCPMCLAAAYWAKMEKIHYCLPKGTASEVGFGDSFIYKDLRLSPGKRKIKMLRYRSAESLGKKIFEKWRSKQGRLY